MFATLSSRQASHRTSPPQKLPRPALPQPRRSSPLEKAHAPQRYSTTDPKAVFFQLFEVIAARFMFVLRDARLDVFSREAVGGGTWIHTAAGPGFIACSAGRGTRVVLRFAAPIQPERSTRIVRTR